MDTLYRAACTGWPSSEPVLPYGVPGAKLSSSGSGAWITTATRGAGMSEVLRTVGCGRALLCQRNCIHSHHPGTPLLALPPLTLLLQLLRRQRLRSGHLLLLLLLRSHLAKSRHLSCLPVVLQRACTAGVWLLRSHHHQRRANPAPLRGNCRRTSSPGLRGPVLSPPAQILR